MAGSSFLLLEDCEVWTLGCQIPERGGHESTLECLYGTIGRWKAACLQGHHKLMLVKIALVGICKLE